MNNARENYYAEEEDTSNTTSAEEPILFGLTVRKITSIALILLVLVIALFLVLNLLGQKGGPFFLDPNGDKLQGHVTLSKDGKLIDSFTMDGNKLTLQGNPNNTVYSTINTNGVISGNRKVEFTIKDSRGRITSIKVSPSDVSIDENGGIHFSFKPTEDMNLEGYYDENTGEYIFPNGDSIDLEFEFVITNDENDTAIIDIPAEFIFQEFVQSGCIAFEKTTIRESTHFGALELNTRMRVLCDVPSDLLADLAWQSERMGNVEIRFNELYKNSSVLTPYAKSVYNTIPQGEYNVKIIFTPFKEYSGQTASFFVNFGLGTSTAKLDFDVVIDNLEQCIKLTPEKVVIPADQDSANLTIDVSSCASSRVEISICDNNPNCASGSEGGIDVSQMFFSLNTGSNATKTIRITRGEIAGAYGATIYARAPGIEKVFVDDKLVIVEPNSDAIIVPDKYVISLIGGARDSARLTNKTLAEEVPVSASICSVYKSSLGITGDTSLGAAITQYAGTKSWWNDLATNPDRYSGSGKYQASLVNTLYALDNIRAAAQQSSMQKNALIKTAYLAGTALNASTLAAQDSGATAQESIEDLVTKSDSYNNFKNVDIASTYTQLATNAGSLYYGATTVGEATYTARAACAAYQTAATSSCTVASANAASASTMEDTASGILLTEYALNAKSIYDSTAALADPIADINPSAASSKTNATVQKIGELKESAAKVNNYLRLALASASVDDFSSASKEDASAKNYLLLAKTETANAILLGQQAMSTAAEADDELTQMIAQEQSDLDKVTGYASLAVGIIELAASLTSVHSTAQGFVTSAKASLTTSAGQLTGGCVVSKIPGCCALTQPVSLYWGADNAVAAQLTAMNTAYAPLVALGMLTVGLQGYDMWRQTELPTVTTATNTAKTSLADVVAKVGVVNQNLIALNAALDPAIDAADWLSQQEKEASLGSTYDNSVGITFSEEFNKKRMTGLISTAIINGFVNGAYAGGVYTTANTFATGSASPIRTEENNVTKENKVSFEESTTTLESSDGLKENCSNQVSLTVPDYIINLVQDGKQINVSTPGVTAVWDHSDAKVFDVFESQETGIKFANSGLKNNSYGTVEFNITKHIHANPTELSGNNFGPFNVTDSSVEEMKVKYHFKFNSMPRAGNNYVPIAENDCTDGLMRGKSGSEGIPKVIMSWDWNSVKGIGSLAGGANAQRSVTNAIVGENNLDEPYLDATQLTILLSKKLGSLSNFLETVNPQCPENPAQKILTAVRPFISNPETGLPYTGETQDAGNFCYLPLTTRFYDGKPALYYFVEDSPQTTWEYFFSDTERVNNAQELIKLVDFNVNLMRDGYGTDFQYDFVNRFTTAIMQAGPSFMDPNQGARRYFSDKDRIYYSSQANSLNSNTKWVLPDAGKYRVRMLINFEDTAKIFDGSNPQARIVVELYSLDPVNSSYSPLYYMPIDGLVGLSASGSRTSYGSSISNGGNFDISKSSGVYIDSQQNNSLVKINYSKVEDFFTLNALPSMRGKLLDLKYNYNPKTMRDENSYIKQFASVATPLLFEIQGTQGEQTFYTYSIKRNNQPINSTFSNMFLLSAVGDCTDLAGVPLSNFYYKAPDYGENKQYGVLLPTAQVSGKTYLKTIAYSPLMDAFDLLKPLNGQIYSSSDIKGVNNPVALNGISGMLYNDKSANSTPASLTDLLKGVEAKNICVSSLGDREYFFWPEEKLYATNSLEDASLTTLENTAKATCVK
ncbi:MAG: hypothetical protein WCW44_03445 [archaeon]|jgi:hypothetical protein